MVMDVGLQAFDPLVRNWFLATYRTPTGIQAMAWPRIAAGEHVLVTAPTGSGKTLTAFLWTLNQLATGLLPPDRTGTLYVSPLKALNNDIQRNLIKPLRGLRTFFNAHGREMHPVRILTRSGDTPQADRRRMYRHPPEILITTPESLNLLLSSRSGRSMLTSLSTVILDEIHAVAGVKRGAHLMSAVERLTLLSGEFQRIVLSATVKPMAAIAAFAAGHRLVDPAGTRYQPRPMTILQAGMDKRYDIRIRAPELPDRATRGEAYWETMAAELERIVSGNRATLIFANSRRLCEKLTLLLNRHAGVPIAYAHHGSLSREIRQAVEERLKNGELRAIIATSSLELGIDIGALDEVVLVQTPPEVAAAIQRIGRSGHGVGETGRGSLFPTHAGDILATTALVRAMADQDIESVTPPAAPLDVLAQILVSMTSLETWDRDRLYSFIRTCHSYHGLVRRHFDLVLEMLAGRYAETRIRELQPRIALDALDNTVRARKGALLNLYSAGGTIPDRGYYQLRHAQTNARIGELDEEFVWEARIGQAFTLGTQHWRIQRITNNEVMVAPGGPETMAVPFWRADLRGRSFHFSQLIGELLEEASRDLDDPAFPLRLQRNYHMDESTAMRLAAYLKSQRAAAGGILPHRHHVLVEETATGPGGAPGSQVVIHTFWGARVNRPLALALDAAWEERFGGRLEIFAADDCVVLQLPEEGNAENLMGLVTPGNLDRLLRRRLEGSGLFGAQFRESAERALLITRTRLNQRMPLWMTRLRAQKLLAAVLRYEDFPMVLEAWRSCLLDEFDRSALGEMLEELATGRTSWSVVRTSHPSPMAMQTTWRQVNRYMYQDDEPSGGAASRLSDDLLRDLVFRDEVRPRLPRATAERFAAKRRRTFHGYAPGDELELLEYVKERLLVPVEEWEELLAAMARDHKFQPAPGGLDWKLLLVTLPGALPPAIAALETLPRLARALDIPVEALTPRRLDGNRPPPEIPVPLIEDAPDASPAQVLSEWLRYYGPIAPDQVRMVLGGWVDDVMGDLIREGLLVIGPLLAEREDVFVCDAENFASLLRLARLDRAPAVATAPAEKLPLFLARIQGLTGRTTGAEGLRSVLAQLVCFSARAELWESEFLPARLERWDPLWIDRALREDGVLWLGAGDGSIQFCREADLDLLETVDACAQPGKPGATPAATGADRDATLPGLFPDPRAKYDLAALAMRTELSSRRLSALLWDGVWHGRIANDSFAALRRGLETGFAAPEPRRLEQHGRRRGFRRPPPAPPGLGNWFLAPSLEREDDLLVREELSKERVRLLLERYGILFRELLARESTGFRWRDVFRSLRLMEFSGEVVSGYFFAGIGGPQFMSHAALRMVQRDLDEDAVYWLHAMDPASMCGVGLNDLKGLLPRRVAGAHLVYHGSRLIMVSQRQGSVLQILAGPGDEVLPRGLEVLRHLLTRAFMPLPRIVVETINDEDAATGPYADVLRDQFECETDYRKLILYGPRSSP
ncbi:DEAD/DEAH box helicase [bacterium]|nr:DEAD/DEAH box helicase [candidate division CSSED10-310 bacterium]